MKIIKYASVFSTITDVVAYLLTYPWLVATSHLAASYLTTTDEKGKHALKIWRFLVLGPILTVLSVALLPLFILGQTIWMALIYSKADRKDFAVVTFQDPDPPSGDAGECTFVTANILLGVEFTGKYQNMPSVYSRLSNILNAFDRTEKIKHNLVKDDSNVKRDFITEFFPDADFMLLQEVWDRFFAAAVIYRLRKKGFSHFVTDVARQAFHTNLCTGSSGLFIASRYPILEVAFVPFKAKFRNWQAFISYGVVMAKVDLTGNRVLQAKERRKVGYLACLHLMAYQRDEDLIGPAMGQVLQSFDGFREKNYDSENEEAVFAVIGGDFNADNMSPADTANSSHPLLSKYVDVCVETPGKDKDWAIGTELRQYRVYDEASSTPGNFKEVLQDDVKRRIYVIDADVVEQNMSLMTCEPDTGSSGRLEATPTGGMRRVDRILFDPTCTTSTPAGASFSAALAGQTDHIPYSLTLIKSKKNK